jgi:putative folate metabolism gamma-glutamate ligase
MHVAPIHTRPIIDKGDICAFLDEFLPPLKERSIIVITSKIVSILEGRTVDKPADKKELVKQEAEYFIEESVWKKYNLLITRKNDIMIANAGIDESNANGRFILWPKDPFFTCAVIWNHLRIRHDRKLLGVIITDSRLTPLRWGTLGIGLAWCGFEPLNDYRGTPDIFGEPLKVTQSSVLDGIAAAAVLVMGEGSEQTPLAIVTNIPFVRFTNHPPTEKERKKLQIAIEDDVYAPLLTSGKWEKGK